jgi:hypothetical protein
MCSHRNTPAKRIADQDVSRLRSITQTATAEVRNYRRDRDKIRTKFRKFHGGMLQLMMIQRLQDVAAPHHFVAGNDHFVAGNAFLQKILS